MLVLVLAIQFRKPRETDVQKYLARLRAQGEKVTFQELIRGIAPDSSLAHDFILTNVPRLPSCNLDAKIIFDDPYGRPGQAGVDWRSPRPPMTSTSGEILTWDQFNEIMLQAQGPLGEIRESLKTASLAGKVGTNAMDSMPGSISAFRNSARWFNVKVTGELHQGRPAEALADIETLAALAKVNLSPANLLSTAWRMGASKIALSATWEALQFPGWSDTQLEQMQEAWEPLDQLTIAEAGIGGERVLGIEYWDLLRRSSISPLANRGKTATRTWRELVKEWTPDAGYRIYKMTSLNQDELFYLAGFQEAIDTIRAVKGGRPQVLQNFKTNAPDQKLGPPSGPPFNRYYFSNLLMPKLSGLVQHMAQSETVRQMTLTAIAIRRYQLRHGIPPADLTMLCPEFLSQPTYDPMSGKPLRYRPGTNGDWLLYSIGEDGVDDGGDPTPRKGATAGFWTGRDAVWPRAGE